MTMESSEAGEISGMEKWINGQTPVFYEVHGSGAPLDGSALQMGLTGIGKEEAGEYCSETTWWAVHAAERDIFNGASIINQNRMDCDSSGPDGSFPTFHAAPSGIHTPAYSELADDPSTYGDTHLPFTYLSHHPVGQSLTMPNAFSNPQIYQAACSSWSINNGSFDPNVMQGFGTAIVRPDSFHAVGMEVHTSIMGNKKRSQTHGGFIEHNTIAPRSLHAFGDTLSSGACSPISCSDGSGWQQFAKYDSPDTSEHESNCSNYSEYSPPQTRLTRSKRMQMETERPEVMQTVGVADSPERRRENEILVRMRRQNLSYKKIANALNNKYSESTLRGRYRTLSKPRNERVRKPQWLPKDIRLLKQVVEETCNPRDLGTVKWKNVSEKIKELGASYKFGVTTAKKKYEEIRAKGLDAVITACEENRMKPSKR